MNPYKILGIPPTASKDEIESAYERIVDTYQIDNSKDSDDYYLMEDKISEANEAYNTLINELKYKEIRSLIENEQFISAETELNLISDKENPEWNYLKGFVLLKKGWVQSGVNHLKTATELNPTNPEYKETMALLSRKINAIKQNYVRSMAAANMKPQQGGMSPCGGGNAGGGNGGMCNDMGSLGNMMGGGGGNPLSNMMGGSNPLGNMMGGANPLGNNAMGANPMGSVPPNTGTPNPGMNQNPLGGGNASGNPLQNMLMQSLFSGGGGGNGMNMCGNGGGKMC